MNVLMSADAVICHKMQPVTFQGLQTCAITGYLQRMDVFATCGAAMPENFQRHEARGRFVPVRVIDHRVVEMGNDLATCLAPGGEDFEHPMADLYDLAWYVCTEMANNVRQHSRSVHDAKVEAGLWQRPSGWLSSAREYLNRHSRRVRQSLGRWSYRRSFSHGAD